LELLEAILLTIKAADNQISGRTVIQKLVYFEHVKKITSVEYKPHFYGPYSVDVANAVQTLVAQKFINEEIIGYANKDNRWRVYRYQLTDKGKAATEQLNKDNPQMYKEIEGVVRTSKQVVDLEPNTLSWSAKAYYILNKEGHAMTCEEIKADAKNFGWEIPGNVNINNAVDLLNALGLCKSCDL
jgi:hypothetical protein